MGSEIIRTGMGHHGYFAPPLHIGLGRSWALCCVLCAGHGMVIAAIMVVRPDMIGALVIPVALISVYLALAGHALRFAPMAVVGLAVQVDGKLSLRLRDGQFVEAQVLGSSFVHPWLCALNLDVTAGQRRAGVPRHVIIVPDAVEDDCFRRLRVWLEWGWKPITAEQSPHGQ